MNEEVERGEQEGIHQTELCLCCFGKFMRLGLWRIFQAEPQKASVGLLSLIVSPSLCHNVDTSCTLSVQGFQVFGTIKV